MDDAAQYNESFFALSDNERVALVGELEAASRKRGFWYYPDHQEPPQPHPIALTPLIFPRELLGDAHEFARAVSKFQSRLPELWLSNFGDIRKIFPLHARTAQWMKRFHRIRSTPDDLFIRLDVGISVDPENSRPRLTLFENNSLALAGIFNHTVGAALLQNVAWPRITRGRTLPKLVPAPNLIEMTSGWIKSRIGSSPLGSNNKNKPWNLFILDDPKFIKTGSEFRLLAHEFTRRGIPTTHGHIGDLDISNGRVTYGNSPISAAWRDLAYHEVALPTTHRATAPFFQLLNEDRILHGFGSDFVHKGLLECFTNPLYRAFFSQEQWGLFSRTVPWTRVLWNRQTTDPQGNEVELLEFLRAHQHSIVLKPNASFGGHGVVLGPVVLANEWSAALDVAWYQPFQWVAQEYVELQPQETVFVQNGSIIETPCFAAFGLFYCHDTLGLHGRIGSQRVVNVAKGGALACVYLLE